MKRIKQIIEALKVLSSHPSRAIAAASDEVLNIAGGDGRGGPEASDANWHLIRNLLTAIAADAEDMEKPAKAEGEAK